MVISANITILYGNSKCNQTKKTQTYLPFHIIIRTFAHRKKIHNDRRSRIGDNAYLQHC